MASDEELMRACAHARGEAFEELFARYRQPIWAFFARRLRDAARAEELAQDVFVAVLQNAARYRSDAPFRAYLFGIAFNVLAAERRRGVRRGSGSLDAIEPEARATDVDAALWVRQALGKLSQDDREIVMLREFEQLSYEEIADVLEVPINTVRSRLFRARMELRRWLNIPVQKT
jgi:RNA polymerase sigma-70 factor (ECF subfamily)